MATGLNNLWIYKLAENLEIKVHEVTKNFLVEKNTETKTKNYAAIN